MTKQNLGETIIMNAAQLFKKQGYKATSIKQIANASGCTTAALYYYFEGGKSEILETVMRRMQPEQMREAKLQELPPRLGDLIGARMEIMKDNMAVMADRIRWLFMEMANLSDEDKLPFQKQLLGFQSEIKADLQQYIADEKQADQIAWIMFCSFFGYQQLGVTMGLDAHADLTVTKFTEAMQAVIFADLMDLPKRDDAA